MDVVVLVISRELHRRVAPDSTEGLSLSARSLSYPS